MLQEKLMLNVESSLLSRIELDGDVYKVDAEGLYYRDLNRLLRALSNSGARKAEIHGVCGQRYIGTDLDSTMQIDIYGTPGNDLGAFMNGPKLVVNGNAQDACGNTKNDGLIVVHG
jgi:glutamate synthase domain-containing protein 3